MNFKGSFLVKRQVCGMSAVVNSAGVPIQASPFLDYCFFLLENNSLFVAVLGSSWLSRLSLVAASAGCCPSRVPGLLARWLLLLWSTGCRARGLR